MGKVLKIREVGDPILNKISDEVDIENINEEILEIIEGLKSTLEFGTGLGIAAPQIGINKRMLNIMMKKICKISSTWMWTFRWNSIFRESKREKCICNNR